MRAPKVGQAFLPAKMNRKNVSSSSALLSFDPPILSNRTHGETAVAGAIVVQQVDQVSDFMVIAGELQLNQKAKPMNWPRNSRPRA